MRGMNASSILSDLIELLVDPDTRTALLDLAHVTHGFIGHGRQLLIRR